MSLPSLPDPILVKTKSELLGLVDILLEQPIIAVDTEANSLFAYQEKVCLIQFSIPKIDYIVDPLAIEDISLLGQIFSNPKIEKIFHAAEYDIIILKHDFNFKFVSLFDTMLAARILGWKSQGLSKILQSQFGFIINKKYQRADWGQRPLPGEMLAYAQMDTHFLSTIRNRMKSELQERNRWDLAQEDFKRMCQVEPNFNNEKKNVWSINGANDLKPQQVAVLDQLYKFRDDKAKELDRPLFKVINDKALLNIAVAKPATLYDLEAVPGISKKQVKWIGGELLNSVKQGLNNHPPRKPHTRRYNSDYINRVDLLKTWRKKTAIKMAVESDVVLPKDLLYMIAKNDPQDKKELNCILNSVPWRRKNFGEEIFELLSSSKI
jgi:ribonuclease D